MLYWFLTYNDVNQPKIYICPLLLEPPAHCSMPSYPSRLLQRTGLSSLCYKATSHQLSILYMIMYMFQCYSPNSSQPLLPPLCPQVCPLCLRLYSCPANRFISTILLDCTYMHSYKVFVFLFLTYITLYNRLQVHPPQRFLFFFLITERFSNCHCLGSSLFLLELEQKHVHKATLFC